jgi:hypothetical protein
MFINLFRNVLRIFLELGDYISIVTVSKGIIYKGQGNLVQGTIIILLGIITYSLVVELLLFTFFSKQVAMGEETIKIPLLTIE